MPRAHTQRVASAGGFALQALLQQGVWGHQPAGQGWARAWVLRRSCGRSLTVVRLPLIWLQGWKLVTLLRLSPIAPWNVLNYALSVTAVPLVPYFLASALAVRGGGGGDGAAAASAAAAPAAARSCCSVAAVAAPPAIKDAMPEVPPPLPVAALCETDSRAAGTRAGGFCSTPLPTLAAPFGPAPRPLNRSCPTSCSSSTLAPWRATWLTSSPARQGLAPTPR